MKKLGHNYYVYITTNPGKTVLYIGVTNNLLKRITEHRMNKGIATTFAGKYHCYNLLYYEWFKSIDEAIAREKGLKKLKRSKKDALINRVNPDWIFVSEFENRNRIASICGNGFDGI